MEAKRRSRQELRQFWQLYNQDAIEPAATAFYVGSVLYALFAVLDQLTVETGRSTLMWIRLTVSVILGATPRLLKWHPAPGLHIQAVQAGVFALASAGILGMIAVVDLQAASRYYCGLILALMWGYGFLRLRTRYVSLIGSIICVAYAVISLSGSGLEHKVWINNNFFLGAAFIMGTIIHFRTERRNIHNFRNNQASAYGAPVLLNKKADFLRRVEAAVDANRMFGFSFGLVIFEFQPHRVSGMEPSVVLDAAARVCAAIRHGDCIFVPPERPWCIEVLLRHAPRSPTQEGETLTDWSERAAIRLHAFAVNGLTNLCKGALLFGTATLHGDSGPQTPTEFFDTAVRGLAATRRSEVVADNVP